MTKKKKPRTRRLPIRLATNRPIPGTIAKSVPFPEPHLELLDFTLFDTFTILPGTQPDTLYLFTEPLGQSGKTEVDTNMVMSGTLPKPNSFSVIKIVLDFLNHPSPCDQEQFVRNYSFRFERDMRVWRQGQLQDLLAHMYVGDLKLESQHHFYLALKRQWPTTLDPYGKGIRGRLQLVGRLARAIQ